METLKIRILLNRWELEKTLKIIFIIQVIINIGSLYYPQWNTTLLPIMTTIELFLLIAFYVMVPKIENEMLQHINIDVLEQYILKIEPKYFKGKAKNYYLFKLSGYYYLFGEFEKSMNLLKQVDFNGLPSGPYSVLDYYFQAYICRVKMGCWDKLDNIKQHFMATMSHKVSEYKKKKHYMNYIEIFDKLFVQQTEYQELEVVETTPYEYIRSHYFSAINAVNTQDFNLAKEEFQKIAHYPNQLFMVKEANEWLVANKN